MLEHSHLAFQTSIVKNYKKKKKKISHTQLGIIVQKFAKNYFSL